MPIRGRLWVLWCVSLTGAALLMAAVPAQGEPVKQPAAGPKHLSIDGFYETIFSGKNYDPKVGDGFETVRNDPVFNLLPADALLGDPRLEQRYRFNIEGKMDDHLSLFYDIEQEPDFPEKFDIRVKYDQSELTFGDFDAHFKNGSFIDVQKNFRGLKVISYDKDWDFMAVQAQERSKQKRLEVFGNGRQEMSLGNQFILERSVRVWVNNAPQLEGTDYRVNYLDGTLTFSTVKSQNDVIRVVYEFTNPIESFLPSLSRPNFTGLQYKWAPTRPPLPVYQKRTKQETLWEKETGQFPGALQVSEPTYVLGSETLQLNSKLLKPAEDYRLAEDGSLFLMALVPQEEDTLTATYSYYAASQTSETFLANGTPGPFQLKNKAIDPASFHVFINNREALEYRDFLMDYARGVLLFNYPVSFPDQIIVQYRYFQIDTSAPPIPAEKLGPAIGVTYLSESSSQQTESVQITNEAPTLSENKLITKFNPINTAQDITVKVNGQTATFNYTVNAYKGELTVSAQVFAQIQSQSVTVDYAYQKSFFTEYAFLGNGNNQYQNTVSFQLPNTPVRFNGITEIDLEGGPFPARTRLTVNRDFAVDYGADGQQPIITFYTQSDSTLSALRYYPDVNTRITLRYFYAPNATSDSGTIRQSIVGVTATTPITDRWKVGTELVHSQHNFSKPRNSGQTIITGTNSQVYPLSNQSLVENSEQVLVLGTNRVLTKDKDYFLNYQNGLLTFVNLTPGPNDTIQVTYDFFVTGSSEAGVTQSGNAIQLDSDYQLTDSIRVRNEFKTLDTKFLPIGDIKDNPGTTIFGSNVLWNLTPKDSVEVDYHSRRAYSGLATNNSDLFLNEDSYTATANFMIMNDSVKTSQKLFYQTQALPSANLQGHSLDRQTIEYASQAGFGPKTFETQANLRLSSSTDDYIDQLLPTTQNTQSFGLRSHIEPPDYFIAKKVILEPFITLSNQRATEKNGPSGPEQLASFNQYYDAGTHFEASPHDSLKNVVDLKWGKSHVKPSKDASAFTSDLFNSLFAVFYKPAPWLDSSISFEHKEDQSPLVGQTGLIENRSAIQIHSFSLYDAMLDTQNSGAMWVTRPFKGARFTSSISNGTSFDNNRQNQTASHYDVTTLHQFSPVQGMLFESITLLNSTSSLSNSSQTSGISSNDSYTALAKTEGKLVLSDPVIPIPNLTYSLFLSDKDESRFSSQSVTPTTNIQDKQLPIDTREQSLRYSPGTVSWGPFTLQNFQTALKENWQRQLDETVNSTQVNGSTTSQSTVVDNFDFQSYRYTLAMRTSPVTVVGLDIGTRQSYYDRNRFTDITGSVARRAADLNVETTHSLNPQLDVTGELATSSFNQFSSSAIHQPFNTLYGDASAAAITSMREREKGVLLYTPLSWVSIKGGVERGVLTATQGSNSSYRDSLFNQLIFIGGFIFRPIRDVEISYTWLFKNSREAASGTQGGGTTGIFEFSFLPIKEENFQVAMTYQREDSSGIDLNTVQQDASLQRANAYVPWSLGRRLNTVETGKFTVQVNIPLPQYPYLERFRITGEGILKRISDSLNTANSFSIAGFILKGTLDF